jgi:RNA methyltransferase, TrmH family
MSLITSLQNPRVKNAVRLRDRRHREKQGRILIDGVRELRRAIAAGVKLLEVFVCEPLCNSDDARQLLASWGGSSTAAPTTLPQSGGEIWHVGEPVFQRLAFGQRAEGVLGVAEMPRPTLATLNWNSTSPGWGGSSTVTPTGVPLLRRSSAECEPPPSTACTQAVAHERGECPLIAVLEGVEKPGNVGAVLRSADAAGVSAVIVADGRTDLFNPNAIRASIGTIFTVPVCEAASGETLAWLRERRFQIVAARVDGSVCYTKVDYRRPTAIVLGGEAPGLSAVWSGNDFAAVHLPMLGAADSLNVSVTAAVLFYEALRQREPTAC